MQDTKAGQKPDTSGPTRLRPSHDSAWKQFFSLPVAFKHLMDGFFPEVAAVLDLDTARPISAEWARKGKRRLADAAWRVDYADASGRTLDVVLEFQSKVDSGMATRWMKLARMVFKCRRDAGELGPDGLLRLLGVVIHSGARPWTAPGGAPPWVSSAGDVMVVSPGTYATLDVRHIAAEHPPPRNVISTLFALCGAAAYGDAEAAYRRIETPLRKLAVWLPQLGEAGEALPGAYADWLCATAPAVFAPEATRRFVTRLLGVGDGTEEDDMSIEIQEVWERDMQRVQRDTLHLLAVRKFGTDAAARLAAHLAESDDAARLAEACDWIVDCATGDDLITHIGNGSPVNGAPR